MRPCRHAQKYQIINKSLTGGMVAKPLVKRIFYQNIMGLSHFAINKIDNVLTNLGLFGYNIFTPDFSHINKSEKTYPNQNYTYGKDKKCDGSWEELFFFVKNPSDEFIKKWNDLKDTVPNSSFMRKHKKNPEYTIFGWF